MAMVVKSAVKDMLKKHKMRVSGDFWKAVDAKLEFKLKSAVDRAKGNGRKTLRAFDL